MAALDKGRLDTALAKGEELHFELNLPPKEWKADVPIIVLLGWVGAQDRHLQKYASFLYAAGYPSVRATCPPRLVFNPSVGARRKWAAALLEFVLAIDPEFSRPLVLYSFSNGGAFVVEQIDWLVYNDSRYTILQDRIVGSIFDSGPCYMHFGTLIGALLTTNQPNRGGGGNGSGTMRAPFLLRVLLILAAFVIVLLGPRRPQRFWSGMTNLRVGQKSLYLYSSDDTLCDAAKLSSLIRSRMWAGACVTEVHWDTNGHVQHLVKHPDEYTAAVLSFLHDL